MTPANTTKVAATLLQERSRDALIQGLMKAMESLEPDEAVAFLADLLLAVGADRDQLKARLTTLLATKFGRRSEKATNAQLQLFAEALRRVAGDRTSPIPSADDEQAPSPEPGETAAELIERTNAEIKAEVTARREQRRAEREERRAQQRADKARGSKPVTWPTMSPVPLSEG
ncbi:MAG: transposase [Pseudomonadota bacterium]